MSASTLSPCSLQPGDHLRVPICPGFWHHGIFLGEGLVAHWHDGRRGKALDADLPERLRAARIRITDLEIFAAGRPVERMEEPTDLPSAEIVARARSREGEAGYHLADNNCEHFARWCRQGAAHSRQSRRVERWLARHGDVAGRALALGVLRRSAPALLRVGARGGPVLAVAAECAERMGEAVTRRCTGDDRLARRGGKAASAATCAVAGFAVGGPAGAAAGTLVWAAGEVGARVSVRLARRALNALA
jgi:hypothetical protein